MKFKTKREFDAEFRSYYMPPIFHQESEWQGGTWARPDKPFRNETWNNVLDAAVKNGEVRRSDADRWVQPRWLETDKPSGRP